MTQVLHDGKLSRRDLRAARTLIMRQSTMAQPEQRLWAAVLRSAINDLPDYPDPRNSVVRWFCGRQFTPVAEALDLDPDFVVESLQRVGALPAHHHHHHQEAV